VHVARQYPGRRSRSSSSSVQAARCCPDACRSVGAVTDVLCLQLTLAAGDDVMRQHWVRVIQAASAGGASSSLHDIASAAALTEELLKMKRLPAIKTFLNALGVSMSYSCLKAAGFDLPSLKAAGFEAAAFRAAGYSWSDLKAAGFTSSDCKAAGCDLPSLKALGFDVLSLIADYGYEAVASLGCDVSCILVTPPPPPPCPPLLDNRSASAGPQIPNILDLAPCNALSPARRRQPLHDSSNAPC
jgi:hypothetical protein